MPLVLCFIGSSSQPTKKAGLNLSPACLLSKLCDDAVLVGCHARAVLLARLRNGRSRMELRGFSRAFECVFDLFFFLYLFLLSQNLKFQIFIC